jgi:hypothetical protein
MVVAFSRGYQLVMANAKQTMHWKGNAFVTLGGMELDATFT